LRVDLPSLSVVLGKLCEALGLDPPPLHAHGGGTHVARRDSKQALVLVAAVVDAGLLPLALELTVTVLGPEGSGFFEPATRLEISVLGCTAAFGVLGIGAAEVLLFGPDVTVVGALRDENMGVGVSAVAYVDGEGVGVSISRKVSSEGTGQDKLGFVVQLGGQGDFDFLA